MTETTLWITVGVVSLLAIAVLAALGMMARKMVRRSMLRSHFGDEYHHLVRETGNRRLAERQLKERTRRVQSLKLRDLDPAETRRFGDRWNAIQAKFVDAPGPAVEEAHWMIEEIMKSRGFPAEDERHIYEDVSVARPEVAQSFRRAREIAHKNRTAGATTEELREAMIRYRELFEALVETGMKTHAPRRATA